MLIILEYQWINFVRLSYTKITKHLICYTVRPMLSGGNDVTVSFVEWIITVSKKICARRHETVVWWIKGYKALLSFFLNRLIFKDWMSFTSRQISDHGTIASRALSCWALKFLPLASIRAQSCGGVGAAEKAAEEVYKKLWRSGLLNNHEMLPTSRS